MPQHSSTSSAARTPAEQTLARVAAGLRAARPRTGLDERRVVVLLAARGLEASLQALLRREGTALVHVHVDAAVRLADGCGMPLDACAAGSRAAGAASDGLATKSAC
jgi:hypothetical protein